MRLIAFVCALVSAGAQSINSGGSALGTYSADQYFSPSFTYTDPAFGANSIYRTMRFAPSFSYDVPIQSIGFYVVTLSMDEPNKTAAGQRVFRVTANGQSTSPIDLFACAGLHVPWFVKIVTFVGGGTLHIQFDATMGNAVVNAIDIVRVALVLDSSVVAGGWSIGPRNECPLPALK